MEAVKHYMLDDNNEITWTEDIHVWGKWFEEASRTGRRFVKQDTLEDGTFISTVFLGVDHRFFGDGPPIVFETMIFYPKGDDLDWGGADQWRYATWDQALAGHDQAVAEAKARLAGLVAAIGEIKVES